MEFLVAVAIFMTVVVILLTITIAFYSNEMRNPDLGVRLLVLDLDGCREYVRDVVTIAGDESLYYDFVLICNFALTFRNACEKITNSRRILNISKMHEIEDRFAYGVEKIKALKDDRNTNYETLKQNIYNLSEIKCEMQRFIIELRKKIQPK